MKDLGIPFDGFKSVVEMLDRADASFRAKILTNIRRRDPSLAKRLESRIGTTPQGGEDTATQLLRSQQRAHTRAYGR